MSHFKNISLSKIVVQWIISTVSLLIVALIIPGITITSWGSAFVTSAVIGFLNALLWPLFMRFALPVTVATFGLASLLLNGLIISLTAEILPGFTVSGFWDAVLAAIGLTVFTTITRQLLTIDDDDTFYRNVIKRHASKNFQETDSTTPGILLLQIDGLAYKVLQRAIRDGNAPTMAKWLSSGKYRVESWETDWSSQTGASQAGILMGSNKDIPAFRWYEKKTGQTLTSGRPNDLAQVEKKLSKKHGLLSHDGASRGNLYSGDAGVTLLTVSTITNPDRKHFGQDYYAYFANPYNFTRTVLSSIVDIFRENRAAKFQKKLDILPRLDNRGRLYPVLRAWMTVVVRDIVVQTLISDMYKGRSVIYADFVGYDEVAHHSGIERHETLDILRDVDQQIARLAKAAEGAPRPYHLVILSDHGQTQGATFRQRTGYSLQELVERLTQKKVTAETNNHEDINYLNAAFTEAAQPKGFASNLLRMGTKNIRKNGQDNQNKKKSDSEMKIVGSGCLGLIYFTKFKHRLPLEEINYNYPGLLSGLLTNPYIGFLLVDSKKFGGIVLGREGNYFLKDDHCEGKNPLLPFGKNAAMHVKRTHAFKNVADIMVNSFYDKTMDEVAAFEELVGSHGGLGGNQTHPFILFPSDWYFPETPVIGAENVHKVIKYWMHEKDNKYNASRYM